MQPNVVFIVTDDQGPWAVPWNMPELHMPQLAKLAAEGSRFDSFYCASPVCSPARASLLTGRMPSAHGVHDFLTGTNHPRAYPDTFLESQLTFPQVLASSGYNCAMIGKWHVGESRTPAPGFNHWFAHRFGGGPYYDAPIWDKGGEATTEPRYFTEAITQEAEAYLDKHNPSSPFLLYLAPTAPHDPWTAENHPQKYRQPYDGCDFPSVPREEPHPWTRWRKRDFNWAFANPEASLTGYCASLTGVDDLIGRVRARLQTHGLANNTIIIFTADNGFSCGHRGIWGKGNGTWPLNFFDNSVRVPFVLYIPPALRDQYPQLPAVVTDPTSAISVFASICELAGVSAPPDPRRETRTVFESNDQVMVFDEYGGGRMIVAGKYKYVLRAYHEDELYDLENDPEERDNLAVDPSHVEVVRELRGQLEHWFAGRETTANRAFESPVTGYGQIHPTWRGQGVHTYVQGLRPALAEDDTDYSGQYWWRGSK